MDFRNGLKAHSSNKWIIGFLLRIFYDKIQALGISDVFINEKKKIDLSVWILTDYKTGKI